MAVNLIQLSLSWIVGLRMRPGQSEEKFKSKIGTDEAVSRIGQKYFWNSNWEIKKKKLQLYVIVQSKKKLDIGGQCPSLKKIYSNENL